MTRYKVEYEIEGEFHPRSGYPVSDGVQSGGSWYRIPEGAKVTTYLPDGYYLRPQYAYLLKKVAGQWYHWSGEWIMDTISEKSEDSKWLERAFKIGEVNVEE